TTYEPDNLIKKGYISLWKEIIWELTHNKWLTFQLFKKDFFSIYKQSLVGVFWAFIFPIVSVGIFIILNRSGIFNAGKIEVPYPVYAIIGMAFWQLFSTGLVTASNSLVKAGSMLVKINFSKKSLVFSSAAQSLIPFIVQIVLVAVLFLVYQVYPSIKILFIPLLMIPILFLTLGLGFILSIFNSIVRDVSNALSVFMTFLLFLTPVLYAKPKIGALVPLTRFNPLYYLISVPRELILKGTIREWKGYLLSIGLSFLVFVVGLVIFHLTETRITERL
ncbi:MAG: ABC transporter permease, partial [candidate division WOR-3 bacterium]